MTWRAIAARPYKQAYTKAFRCFGHSATVKHVDWSADSSTIASDGRVQYVLPATS